MYPQKRPNLHVGQPSKQSDSVLATDRTFSSQSLEYRFKSALAKLAAEITGISRLIGYVPERVSEGLIDDSKKE